MPANASRTPWWKPQRCVPRVTSHQATKGNVPAVPITGGPAFRPEDLPRRWPQPAARRWPEGGVPVFNKGANSLPGSS